MKAAVAGLPSICSIPLSFARADLSVWSLRLGQFSVLKFNGCLPEFSASSCN